MTYLYFQNDRYIFIDFTDLDIESKNDEKAYLLFYQRRWGSLFNFEIWPHM